MPIVPARGIARGYERNASCEGAVIARERSDEAIQTEPRQPACGMVRRASARQSPDGQGRFTVIASGSEAIGTKAFGSSVWIALMSFVNAQAERLLSVS
jgi:hypothetical protein